MMKLYHLRKFRTLINSSTGPESSGVTGNNVKYAQKKNTPENYDRVSDLLQTLVLAEKQNTIAVK
jgi:hypothetical protein